MSKYVVIGREWFQQSAWSETLNVELVGQKAFGLATLPSGWTPEYFVITTAAFKRWKGDLSVGQLSWLADFLSPCLELLAASYTNVIIRSSAVNETLDDRGTHVSLVCEPKLAEVLETIEFLYHDLRGKYGQHDIPDIAYIVQGFIKPNRFGHLSNERRVQRNRNNWLYEIEGGETGTNQDSGVLTSIQTNLSSANLDDKLPNALRQVANYYYSRDPERRFHLEWVYAKDRLWVVQVDEENTKRNTAPGSEWKVAAPKLQLVADGLNVFKAERYASDRWDKIRCVRDFRDSMLPFAKVFVLEDPSVLEKLAEGVVPPPLLDDLERLAAYPIVIRTDVNRSKKKEGFLYPRTETAMSVDTAKQFLLATVQHFLQQGLSCYDFCFIAHRFIVSRSCAFSYSRPGSQQVIVDSSWGLPDGLLYYPHDTFRLTNSSDGLVKRKQIRCKTDYLDVDQDGNWVQKRSGENWDWGESLKDSQLEKIFEYTTKLARNLNKPVQIMFFVGVRSDSGHPDVLPWFYTDHTVGSFTLDSAQRYGKQRILVKEDKDLKELKLQLKHKTGKQNILIQVKLTPKFLRNEELLEEIASTALEYSLPVELEGSILSHAYYILQKRGVRVLCPTVWEDNTFGNNQTFGKLVRDNIPELIESHGEQSTVIKLPDAQRMAFLKAKVIEEALELYGETEPEKAFEELADLYEVIRTLLDVYERTFSELEAAAAKKRSARGGFEKGLILMETSYVPLIDVQEPGLFKVEKASISHKNYADHEQELRALLQPKWREGCLTIPLVPSPVEKHFLSTTVLPLDDEREIVIKYKAKTVEIAIQDVVNNEDPNQLKLF